MKIYKVNFYETYMMKEQGIRFRLAEPLPDSIHYKSEWEEFDIEIPEGFSIAEDAIGNKYLQYGEYDVEIGEDKKGIFFAICSAHPRKVYVKVLK